MDVKDLLEFGYFPKELPPAFSTETLANKFIEINTQCQALSITKNSPSKLLEYSIPKKDYIRRKLSIPNPFHQSDLSQKICDKWNEIDAFCQKSKISASRPVENTSKDTDSRAITTLKEFYEFQKDCIIDSFDKMYELKVDITWFYHSIYTHTIPWALHTKQTAKARKYDKTLLGNNLDTLIRNCQHGQTIGIPVGPDTSLVIAEIIACFIDQELQEKFPDIKGYRYFDDYFLFFTRREKAEEVFRFLQSTLNDFQLTPNETKTIISQYPLPFDTVWATSISTFNLRNGEKEQEKDLWKYFNLVFELFNKYMNDPVLIYALRRIGNYNIDSNNWKLFQSFILKCTLLDPRTIKDVIRILLANKKYVENKTIESVTEQLFDYHIVKGHSYEIAWTLWLAKTFDIKINEENANYIFNSNDVIPIIIALDLKHNGLIDSKVDTSHLIDGLTKESLLEEKWLLTYESIIKGWLTPKDTTIFDDNPYFKILKQNGVNFYDETKQLSPVVVQIEPIKPHVEEVILPDTSGIIYVPSTKYK